MEKFVIDGGVPLSGTIVPAGNKNGALPILAASVLTEDEVIAAQRAADPRRRRDARDPRRRSASTSTGAGANEVTLVRAPTSTRRDVDPELAEQIRASFLLAGPLLARFGRAMMPPPGGDVIGRRRLDPHLDAFRALGASVDCERDIVLHAAARACAPRDVFMDEPSVMATENALMAAALTPGTTVIAQRRLRAARAGPRADARQDGRRIEGSART